MTSAALGSTLSRVEIETWFRLSKSFPDFLEYAGFTGPPKTIMSLTKGRRETIIDAKHTDVVLMQMAWTLCFCVPTQVLWLTDRYRNDSPIPKIWNIIEKLGNIDTNMERSGNQVRFDNGNILSVCPTHPNAGCGVAPTHLIIEGCEPTSSTWRDIVNNLAPVLCSVAKGNERIVTIRPK